MVHERLYATLRGLVDDRFWPLFLREGTAYPAMTYQHAGNSELPFVNQNQLIENYRIQVRIYALSYTQCANLRGQVIESVRAMNEFMEQNIDFDGYEPDTRLFTWTLDFNFRNA